MDASFINILKIQINTVKKDYGCTYFNFSIV